MRIKEAILVLALCSCLATTVGAGGVINEIDILKQKVLVLNDQLASKNEEVERLLETVAQLQSELDTMQALIPVLSNDHSSGRVGVYFNFHAAAVDGFLERDNWTNEVFLIRQLRTGAEGNAVLWRQPNGGSLGDSHGRWDPSPPFSGTEWVSGESFTILGPKR